VSTIELVWVLVLSSLFEMIAFHKCWNSWRVLCWKACQLYSIVGQNAHFTLH
jgi:hypothetical protein